VVPRYFSEIYPKQPNPNESFSHVVTAISDTPAKDGRYLKAQMQSITIPERTVPNFRFRQPTDYPSKARELSSYEQSVAKDTGITDPSESLSVGNKVRFDSAAQSAVMLGLSQGDAASRREEGINYAKEVSRLRKSTSELFSTTPKQTIVGGAFAHRSMRHTIPLMGAYLHQQHGSITASSDLSEHSSKLVENLQEKGYPVSVQGGKKPRATNPIEFNDSMWTVHPAEIPSIQANSQELSTDEVASAKKHFREIRHGQKLGSQFDAHLPKPQGEQLQLPGMEK
jgi:hypothetical protein